MKIIPAYKSVLSSTVKVITIELTPVSISWTILSAVICMVSQRVLTSLEISESISYCSTYETFFDRCIIFIFDQILFYNRECITHESLPKNYNQIYWFLNNSFTIWDNSLINSNNRIFVTHMIYKAINTLTLRRRNKAGEPRQNTYEPRAIKPKPQAYRSEVKLNIDHRNTTPNRGTTGFTHTALPYYWFIPQLKLHWPRHVESCKLTISSELLGRHRQFHIKYRI